MRRVEFLMMKRREVHIAARRPAWPLAEHAQQAAIGFLKAHRRAIRISLRHSAMGCMKGMRSRTATSPSSTAASKAETIDFRRSRRKLVSGAR